MIKTTLAALLVMFSALAHAAGVDVNKANQAELEAVKGIGPAMAMRMMTERKKGDFKDWSDLMGRVKGVKEHQATKLSEAGLTVNGSAYKAADAKTPPKK